MSEAASAGALGSVKNVIVTVADGQASIRPKPRASTCRVSRRAIREAASDPWWLTSPALCPWPSPSIRATRARSRSMARRASRRTRRPFTTSPRITT